MTRLVWCTILNDRRNWRRGTTSGSFSSFLNNRLETLLSVPVLRRNEQKSIENELKIEDLKLFRFFSKSLISESGLRSEGSGIAIHEIYTDR